jgi:uncharacterized membrane-anchored protein YjiN (DUF445 family)
MISKEFILQKINQLEAQHGNDKDGGYALVDDIERLFNSLSDEGKQLLINELVDLIDKQDANLWGVAIESIVRFQSAGTGEYLFQLTKNKKRKNEWLDQIFLALARLGYKNPSKEIVKYIEKGLKNGRNAVIPILAALCHNHLDDYIRLTSRFLIDSINKNPKLVENFSSAFLRNIIEEDVKILRDLTEAIFYEDKTAAKMISNIFQDYLDKPWIQNEFGSDHVNLLKRQINRLNIS